MGTGTGTSEEITHISISLGTGDKDL